MIDRQLDWLSAEEQRVLEAASVAGVEFSAAGVAAGLAQEVEHVDDWCTSLARRGQFLRTSGERAWPDGTVAGSYALSMPCISRCSISGSRPRSGAAAPAHWGTPGGRHGAQVGDIAAELAMHFERGRDSQRAVQYLRQAGQRSMERSAYVEAVVHLTRGLEVLKTLPATPERNQQELTLHIALGAALQMAKGVRSARSGGRLHPGIRVVSTGGRDARLSKVLFGLWRIYAHSHSCTGSRDRGNICCVWRNVPTTPRSLSPPTMLSG